MSDTPRTDDRVVIIDGNPWVNAPFACQLERELRAANQRIKLLEEAGNEIIWWFCPKDTSHLSSMQSDALRRWNRAKEAKP